MKEIISNTHQNSVEEIKLTVVPETFLDTLLTTQNKILESVNKSKHPILNGYIPEKIAIELINKKTTWFWKMRKSGKLKYNKIGQTIYYLVEDLKSLLSSK